MRKLTSTRNINKDSVLRLYLKGFGYAKIRIISITEHYIAACATEDFFKRVREGDAVECYLWVEDEASCEFSLGVLGKINPGIEIVFLSHTTEIRYSTERKCLRARVGIPFKFYTLPVARGESAFYSEEIVFHEGRISELTDREAVFSYQDPLPLTCLVKGHICADGLDIEVTGRINDYTESTDGHIYVIEFMGLNDRERDKILEYIFTVYRE
jgi:hypothetical protein